MGVSKMDMYTEDIKTVAKIAKVFAHPARVAILSYISQQPSCICGDLVDEIGLAQATISQHLKVIKDAGLLEGTIEGKAICYCLNTEVFEQFKTLLNQYFSTTAARCC